MLLLVSGLFFYPEDGSDISIRNTCLFGNIIALQPTLQYSAYNIYMWPGYRRRAHRLEAA
jgi:hypothetical protein